MFQHMPARIYRSGRGHARGMIDAFEAIVCGGAVEAMRRHLCRRVAWHAHAAMPRRSPQF